MNRNLCTHVRWEKPEPIDLLPTELKLGTVFHLLTKRFVILQTCLHFCIFLPV